MAAMVAYLVIFVLSVALTPLTLYWYLNKEGDDTLESEPLEEEI